MKHSDIIKLQELGLITAEQRQKIIETLHIKEDQNKFLVILSVLGALLIVGGMILLISANWEDIHRGVKILCGLALMLSAWGVGWHLRENRGNHPKTGEALYMVGAGLWLANIALIGQIYNLSSRPPNAFLLWLAGFAALPWILRSKGLFVLSLASFWIWLGMELNDRHSWFGVEWDEAQMALYAMTGLLVAGWGTWLRAGRWSEFAGPAEKTGLLALAICCYPMCWELAHRLDVMKSWPAIGLMSVVTVLALALLGLGLRNPKLELDTQWRWAWGLSLGTVAALLWVWLLFASGERSFYYHDASGVISGWVARIALFLFAMMQIQAGLSMRSSFMVNLGLVLIGGVLLAAFVRLFGSMATTGWMFLITGVFLMALGVYLERKRRKLMARLNSQHS